MSKSLKKQRHQLVRKLLVNLLSLWVATTPIHSSRAAPPPAKPHLVEHIELYDIPLSEVLRLLSDQYGLNVIASKKAAQVSVTMYLNMVTAEDILETLARTYNLWYKKDEHSTIFRLYTADEFRLGNVDSNREHLEVFTARYQNVLSIAYAIKNLYPERVRMQLGEEQNVIYQDLQQRFRKFDLFAGRSSTNTSTGSNSRSGSNGNNNSGNTAGGGGNNNSNGSSTNSVGGSGGNQSFSNNTQSLGNQNGIGSNSNSQSLINNNGLEKKLQDVVAGDMQSAEQVNQFIHEDAQIFITVLKNQNNILVRTRDPMAIQEIKTLIGGLDKPPITVLLEVKILSVSLNDGYNSVFDISLADNASGLAGSRTPISTTTSTTTQTSGQAASTTTTQSSGIGSNTINPVQVVGTGAATLAGAQVIGPALLAKVVSDQFEAKLQLLEKEGRVTELATPMVSTANQEVSRINLVNEVPIVRTYNFVTSTGTGGIQTGGTQVGRLEPQVSTEQIGTTLIMTPSISKDKSVNLNILIDRSALSTAQSNIPVENGQGLIQNVPVDTVERRSYAGNVIMKDNTPMAIGGLITERAADSESKVPVLGDIPGLGFFFNNQGRQRQRDELVIMITPHIIENMQEGNRLSEDILERNSVHPTVKTHENLDIYSNETGEHKDYQLDKPYKEYRGQDQLDAYKWQNQTDMQRDPRAAPNPADKPLVKERPHVSSAAQEIYMQLTQYAAKSVRQSPAEWEKLPKIAQVQLRTRGVVDLFGNPDAHVLPVASWRQSGVYVTALEVRNAGPRSVQLDHRRIKGRWLAATIESTALAPKQHLGDSTYLYLISADAFDEVLPR